MREVRAVVYGVGAMNSIATRLLLDKGVSIVGAIARSPEKVGRDLGEVASLGRTLGVRVESDADEVLGGRSVDIAVIAVSSYGEHVSQLGGVALEQAEEAGTCARE